jgi:hypothetical protein
MQNDFSGTRLRSLMYPTTSESFLFFPFRLSDKALTLSQS